MAVPSSGTLYMSMFHAEFGLGYSFNSYRGKGNVPTSGTIYFSQMYGAANIIQEGPYYTPTGSAYRWDSSVDNAYDRFFWNSSTPTVAGIAINSTSYTLGSWTYYRGNFRAGSNTTPPWYLYEIYRIGRY